MVNVMLSYHSTVDTNVNPAHLDTWSPVSYPGTIGHAGEVNHGTFFWKAGTEGLLGNNNVHVGIRCKMASVSL
jgi:agmatinase